MEVTAVQLFYGKTPLKFTAGGCPVSIGWIPLGSSVSFNPTDFQQRAWPVRILAHLSSAIIGIGTIAKAGAYLLQWQEVADTAPLKAFGLLAAKGASFALLPIGGGALTQILADAGTSTGKETLEKLSVVNAVACFMIISLWGFAVLWLAFIG